MKKIFSMVSLCLLTFALAGCGGGSAQQQATTNVQATQQSNNNNQQPANNDKKVLVVYYTHSGNTREIAEQIHKRTGGDIVEIKTVKPYPQDYNATTRQARQELDSGFKPELQLMHIDFSKYDTVFIGSPNWWSTIATPVISFLSQNNMSGKSVIPFITHGGSGLGRSVNHIRELCPQATVKDGLAIRGGHVKNAQNDVDGWLKKLGVI